MKTLRRGWHRSRGWLAARRRDSELAEEIAAHLDMQAEDNVRAGMSPEAARRAARLKFGGVEAIKERSRDQRSLPWLHDLAHDMRHGARSLVRAPGFAVVALLTLTLGIGANTAIFSIVNGVILRPLAYPRPGQLMYFTTQFPGLGFTEFWVSPPEYMELRELSRSYSAVGAYTIGEVNLSWNDRPLRIRSAAVDAHLLDALGVVPVQGRPFAAGETETSGPASAPGPPLPPPVAILSHEIWQAVFGGRPVLGEDVEVNGRPHEIVGVMPPGADVLDNRTEIWLPLGLNPADRQSRAGHFLYVIGRLRDGVTAAAAERELEALLANWGERVGVPSDAHVLTPPDVEAGHHLQMWPVQDEVLGGAGRAIWALQAGVAVVLLIVCVNLANLFLARSEARRRELAVRVALGASRGRLLRQSLTEGVLLALTGGALGVLLAVAGVPALVRAYPDSLPRTSEVGVDLTVLLFTLGVSIASGGLLAIAPAVQTHLKGLMSALKDGDTRGTAGASRHYFRRALVVIEVALAVALVSGAGLLVRTVYNLTAVDAGFERASLTTFSVTLPQVNYARPLERAQLYQRLLAELRTVPGVRAATAMSGLPPVRPLAAEDIQIEGYTAPPDGPVENVDYAQVVMSDYFETLGVPIVRGRGFDLADVGSTDVVAIVNETFADTFWPGQDPLGRRVRLCCGDMVPWFTVIGVAGDVKQGGLDQEAGTELYLFGDQLARFNGGGRGANMPGTMNVVLRSTLPPSALGPTIERVVREADPGVPVVRLREMDEVFAESISRPRLLAQLMGGFGGLALLLAAIGTYGALSFMVQARRREIGIRLALGAGRSSVLAQTMKGGFLLTGIGAAAGLVLASGLNRLLASLLFGVGPADAATLAAVIGVVGLAAALACSVPAWRASRLDPNEILRTD